MAKECCWLILDIRRVKDEHLDSSMKNQLDNAEHKLGYVALCLTSLEKAHTENGILLQLRELFMEALGVFSEISSYMNDQDKKSETIGMLSKMVKIIRLENIAERVKTSKPSRSSSLITMEMVESVVALLDCYGSMVPNCIEARLTYAVREKLLYLSHFLRLTANRCLEHESINDLFTYAEDVAYTALYLRFLDLAYNKDKDDYQSYVLDSEFSKLLERIRPMNATRPELRQIYLNLLIESKTSRSKIRVDTTTMYCLVNALEEDLKELLSRDSSLKTTFDDQILWLQQVLSYLSKVLIDIAFEGTPLEEFSSLQSHIEALIIEAAIMIYSSLYDEEGMKNTEIHHELFLLQLKFNHVEVEINLIRLPNGEATIMAPLKYLIDSVQEKLILLGTFLMDSSEQCKEQTKITDFLILIQSVTNQAWSVVRFLSRDSKQEDMAREINHLHFKLLLKFKFIEAVIGQMRPNISTTWTLDHPTINLLNFLRIDFDVIDSYFSMLKSSKTQSSHIPTVDEVWMGFHEYILGNVLLKDESYLTFTVANKVKKYYYGLLLLVTYLVDLPVQSIECMKVNLVLQFLTIAFKLINADESLMILLKEKKVLKAEILDLIESVHEELIFLRASLMDVLTQHTELKEFHDLLMHAEVAAHKLEQISDSCYGSFGDGSSTQQMRLPLSDQLQEIETVKVEFRKVFFQLLDASPCHTTDGEGLINFLLNRQDRQLNSDDCSISFLKNQILVVKDKSEYLGSFVADIVQYRDMHQELNDLVRRVQGINYVCFFHVKGYKPAWYYMLYISDVKQLLKHIEEEVKTICLKVPHSLGYSFPKTDGLGFFNCFLHKLEELSRSKIDSIIDLKQQIESVKESLFCLRSLINHYPENIDEHDEVYGCIITSVTEMAYKAEYVIDSCLTNSHPLWYKFLWISEVVDNIKLENQAVSETCGRKKIDLTAHKVANTSVSLVPSISGNNTPRTNEEMEGFQEAMDKIKNQILRRSSHLDVFSIVGMAGIGKTTLAEKIYNDLIATPHFDVHAKCRVTQVYSWKELLLTILNDVLGPADRSEKEDGELANELRQVLLTKRFLILIDDLWDKTAWDYLYMCFKDAHSGSRIILTTRLNDIANYAKCESNPHHLRLFTDDESWTLLQEEVFQGDICPPELVDVGFRIAKSCGGLPLFIVLVAGVLKEKKKNEDSWKEVEESLGSHNVGSLEEESMSLIEFSYKNLPHYLKPCFLYFGGFLKGKDIHVSKLFRLWQAEGFVKANNEKTTEDVTQYFFEDLISRNIVMAMERRPNSKVKRCRIHDLLHKFCLEKAKQENFLNQINRGVDKLPKKPEDYRLFIHSYQDEIDSWRPCCSNVRSLQFKVVDPDNLLWPRDISFIIESFKLVKVLDLESFNVGGTFPSEIQCLIHLRYLAVQTDANSIPSFIAKLQNLETFVVRGLGGEVILPYSLLGMVKLRHLLVKRRASFSLHENMVQSHTCSWYLETFSTPRLSYGKDAETILSSMPNLRKLSCIFLGTFSYSEKLKGRCVLFPRLQFLHRLESVKLVSNSYPAKLPHEFNFPSKLRELTLSKFRLPWSEISIIGELPNLEILKLLFRAFEGDQWEVKDSAFPELKYLKLDNINFSQWSISDDAFPKLEILSLTKCEQLEEIPSHFGEAISITSIDVNRCGWCVANSALEIQRMQHEDMANDAFTVTIQPPDWATRTSL